MFRKIVLVQLFLIIGTNYVFSNGVPEIGNGNIISIDRPVSSTFTTIILGTNGLLNIYQSEKERISITIDSNLEYYIETEIIDGVLEIKTRKSNGIRPTVNTINVYTPNIEQLSILGTGNIMIIDMIVSESLLLNISGVGKITGKVECTNDLKLSISGNGNMRIAGKSTFLKIETSGSADIDCSELEVYEAAVRINGSGNVQLNVIDFLEGRIYGSGNILYHGKPRIAFDGFGSGNIRRID